MGSWVEGGVGGVGGASRDSGCKLVGEVGDLASGRATGCDRMGEHTIFCSSGASALGFSLRSTGSGKSGSSGDFTLVATEASGGLASYTGRREQRLRDEGFRSQHLPSGAFSKGLHLLK